MSTIEDIHRPTSCQWQCHRNRGNIGIPNTRLSIFYLSTGASIKSGVKEG